MRADQPVEVRVTGGRRACPPEDVGGIGSYNELVALLASGEPPEDEWLQEKLAWLSTDFDPAEFDPAAASAVDIRGRRGSVVAGRAALYPP